MVKKRGFTLIEVIIGMSLLGLISVTTLPIITTAFMNLKNHNIKMKMNYTAEVVIERIKAFDENYLDLYIYDTKVSDIIQTFKLSEDSNFTLSKDDESFLIEIKKENHSDKIWKVAVYVYHDIEGSNINHVEYKMYLPKK